MSFIIRVLGTLAISVGATIAANVVLSQDPAAELERIKRNTDTLKALVKSRSSKPTV